MGMNAPARVTLRKVFARLKDTFREPADLVLAARIGFFLWRAPHVLARRHVREYLRELEERRPHRNGPTDAAHARIERIRSLWLRMPFFRQRDSCYLRSLSTYRFLNPGDEAMQLHFGVEEREGTSVRRRAHVWVSVGSRTFEGPPQSCGKLREIPLMQALP